MKQKIKNLGLLAILSVLTIAATSNFASASLPGDYSHEHATALHEPNLVCGDHLCGLHEKKVTSNVIQTGFKGKILLS